MTRFLINTFLKKNVRELLTKALAILQNDLETVNYTNHGKFYSIPVAIQHA